MMITVATPKQIRELMKVEGLTNDEVKSHLQVTLSLSSLRHARKSFCTKPDTVPALHIIPDKLKKMISLPFFDRNIGCIQGDQAQVHK